MSLHQLIEQGNQAGVLDLLNRGTFLSFFTKKLSPSLGRPIFTLISR
jgi:hypothetical protein